MLGIEQARPGNRLGDISAPSRPTPNGTATACARFLRPRGRAAVPRLARGGPCRRAGTGPELRPGMFLTVEPMINLGRPEVKLLDDGGPR